MHMQLLQFDCQLLNDYIYIYISCNPWKCCAEWLYYYIKQKIDVSSEGPSSRVSSDFSWLLTLDEGPSLETSIFCLMFKVVI